jgi:hypothetical protein
MVHRGKGKRLERVSGTRRKQDMRKLGISLMATLLLCGAVALTAVGAKDRKKTINFTEDVLVKGTLLKKGTYEVRFDSANSQVMILKDGDVVATSKVDVQMMEHKAPYNSAGFKDTDKGKLLTTLTFQGDNRVLVFSNEGAAADGQ